MFEIRIHRGITALLIVFSFGLLTACQSSGLSTETSTPTQTVNSTAPSATPDPESIEEYSEPSPPKFGPTPVPQEWVELPVPGAENAELLIKNADGSLSVFLDEENLDDRHHPAMPSYIWNLNANVEGIDAIVVAFDLIDTVEPDDLYFYGYDRGFFVGLHNLDDVSDVLFYYSRNSNEWDATRIDEDPGKLSHLTAENKLYYPELGEDLSRYTTSDGNGNYVVRIPYEQFNGGASDLVLQFLPGAIYDNVRIYADGSGGFGVGQLDELISEQPPVEVEDFNDLISGMGSEGVSVDGMMRGDVIDFIRSYNDWSPNVIANGLINPDGTTNMYLADYDLEGYEDEIVGEYGIVPEGIMATIIAVDDNEDDLSFGRNRTKFVNFVLDHMVDPETGLIYGIWDNEQGALAAADRDSGATLQIASAMLATNDVDHTRIQALFDAVIEHEILEINNTYYYVPGGEISEDGTVELDLADFAVPDSFMHYFLDMIWYDKEDQQEDPLATYKMLEGFANSLELLLAGQEQNPTNLPADTLLITFNEDGTRTFESVGEFHMDNLYFSVLPISQGHNFASATSGFQFMMAEKFDELIEHFLTAKADGNEEYATQELDQAKEIASYYQNSMRIVNTSYQMYYDVYNFTKIQDGNTIFAAAYDVITGEIIFRDPVGEEDGSAPWNVYQQRFGATNTAVNYALMNLFFHDQELSEESLKMVTTCFEMFGYVLKYEQNMDMSDTEVLTRFFEKGYSVTGNDGIWFERYFSGHSWPSDSSQRAAFDDAENFAWRDESLDEFMLRTLRQAGYTAED
jgi:hypothetical protein